VAPPSARQTPVPIDEAIASLDREQLAEVVKSAADRHEDVERLVRVVAARANGGLSALRDAIDGGLRTRRFLDHRESLAWAQNAQPVVSELSELAAASPSRELVELMERAVGHVIKVLLHADDSAGSIGDLAHELLDAHARACDAGWPTRCGRAARLVRSPARTPTSRRPRSGRRGDRQDLRRSTDDAMAVPAGRRGDG
jgi:hypothetical protein